MDQGLPNVEELKKLAVEQDLPVTDKKLLIVVGTNSLAESKYEAYTNHCQFWFRLGRSYPGINFVFVNPARMSIDRMRNLCAQTALEVGADYLLFLDDDVCVQYDALAKLLSCNADIAAGKVIIRGYPFSWMVFEGTSDEPDGLAPIQDLPESGIKEVGAVGFSFTLIKTNLLRLIPAPWFVTGISNTEDIYFCIKAKQVKPDLKVVVECSTFCGHILWNEVMSPFNRDAYREYYEKLNPQVLEQRKAEEDKKKNPRGDRAEGYLAEVEETIK